MYLLYRSHARDCKHGVPYGRHFGQRQLVPGQRHRWVVFEKDEAQTHHFGHHSMPRGIYRQFPDRRHRGFVCALPWLGHVAVVRTRSSNRHFRSHSLSSVERPNSTIVKHGPHPLPADHQSKLRSWRFGGWGSSTSLPTIAFSRSPEMWTRQLV